MWLKKLLTPQAFPYQWGELRMGWGSAIFVVSSRGLCSLTPLSLGIDDYTANVHHLKLAGVQPLPAGQRILWNQKISEALACPQLVSVLPLDLKGSDLQLQVWQALLQVPKGQLVSYSELAHQIGRPQAVRAVASACAANPVALLVPCHRVVRKDGGLGGYRWGLELKRYLLTQEGAL